MQKAKKIIAFMLAVSLIVGLVPATYVVSAAESEQIGLNETLLFSDTFDAGTSWNTKSPSPTGFWRLNNAQYAGIRNGTAPLGYQTMNARNLYCSKSDDGKLTDVHMKADVCVTAAVCYGGHPQYQLLVARASGPAIPDGIVFGFKTMNGATKSSLVICNYDGSNVPTPLYETEVEYEFNKVHTLELFVDDNFVIAKCDGTTVYAASVDGINMEAGYCGIMDKRSSTVGDETASKGGYFDNFEIYSFQLDGFKTVGTVVADKTGAAIADICLVSGQEKVAELDDVRLSATALKEKQEDLYSDVTVSYSEMLWDATAKRVLLVEELSQTVTTMADKRWTGATIGSSPKFKVDALGTATMTPSGSATAGLSVLNAGQNAKAYTDFYAEYTLTVSELASEARTAIDNFIGTATYGDTVSGTAWMAQMHFDNRSSLIEAGKEFWARLQKLDGNYINYSDSKTASDGIAIGTPVKVGMLVYDNTVTFLLNDKIAATYTNDNVLYEGWFGISQSIRAGKATIKNFVFAPIEKDITIYLIEGAQDGYVGLLSADIRENTDSEKAGIRFCSAAHNQCVVGADKYQLSEVGTLVFNECDEVTAEMMQVCYEDGSYQNEKGFLIGKKKTATRMRNIDQDVSEWGLVLTYEEASMLAEEVYTTYAYAVYEDNNGKQVVKYSTNSKTCSYNELAIENETNKIVAPYLFYDTFSGMCKKEWEISTLRTASFDVINGKLCATYEDVSKVPEITGSIRGGEEWANYAVSADVTLCENMETSERARTVGLVARRSGAYYYEFRLTYQNDVWSANLYRFSSDGTSLLKNLAGTQLTECVGKELQFGEQYNLRLETRGNWLRCYVNGVSVASYLDESPYALQFGTAGMKILNTKVEYEDFIVEQKRAQTIVGLEIVGAIDNTIELYEGFDIDLPNTFVIVRDDDGSYNTVPATREMFSVFDSTKLGEQEITVTYDGFSEPVTVIISERPELRDAFVASIEQTYATIKSTSVLEQEAEIQKLKTTYELFSPYELSKVDDSFLNKYNELVELLERAKDTNLKDYDLLLADSMNDVTAKTWNDSIMGNSAKWLPLNGKLYEVQRPYNLSVLGWQSPNIYGEIYSISAELTMLSEDMYMGVALNITESGYYMARVTNIERDEEGNILYKLELLKRTIHTHEYLKTVYVSELGVELDIGLTFELRLTVKDGVINTYINGQQILTYDDSAKYGQHTSGECGLRILYGDGIYDNVRVYGTAMERSAETVAIEATSYQDDFEDETVGESPSHWQESRGADKAIDNWKIYEKNNSYVYGTEVTDGLTETWLHVFEKEPEFKAKFMITDANHDSKIGFITRRAPDTAFVNIGYDFNTLKWYVASQVSEAGGCEIFWAQDEFRLDLNEWYIAQIRVYGSEVRLFVNGIAVVSTSGVLHTGFGRIGFFTNEASMYVDDVNCTFKYGDIPQDGVISYVLEPDTYSNYTEIESISDGTLLGVGTTKKMSTDAGETWTDITSDATWSSLGDRSYPSILRLHDGIYIQVLQSQNFAVQRSTDLQTWNAVGQMVPDHEITDSTGRQMAILHINSLTEVELSDGTYRVFCPVGFRVYSANGNVGGHYSKIYYSDDSGKSWSCSQTTTKELLPGYSEATTWSESKVIKCSDGTLRMYYSRNNLGCMQYSVSTDDGVTWSGLYQIPELQCAATSFAIIEDTTARGTYYMLWINGKTDYLGSTTPRVRPCLLKSTDGMNWEFLMNCEYMPEVHSVKNGEVLYQILDPSLYVTEDYVYITFGRSEREFADNNAQSHQAQRCYYLRVEKDKLTGRAWDASTVSNLKYPKKIEIDTYPKLTFNYGESFTIAGGILKITALDGTVTYEAMTKNCYAYKLPNMKASSYISSATQSVQLYYVNGYCLEPYTITINKRTLW